MNKIERFSKLTKSEKLASVFSTQDQLKQFWLACNQTQKTFDDFSENTVSNFILPYGIAPNFLINEKLYHVPMVIEESSVVAAASKAAKFWAGFGGFKAKVIDTTKLGHVHFTFDGDVNALFDFFSLIKPTLLENTKPLLSNMEKRGGGLKSIELIDSRNKMNHYFKIEAMFETCDAMGANLINSVLENIAQTFQDEFDQNNTLSSSNLDIVMSILSNYTTRSLVKVSVETKIENLQHLSGDLSAKEFAIRFEKALKIACIDKYRAVTHNKGIMNGIDAVVLATGNDFRAVEACAHAYAARDGEYRSLSNCVLKDDKFIFSLEIPLAIGSVGGLTNLHPLAKETLRVLGEPSAKELMGIIASVGLAQNFGAITSLITTGIQKGHMKMHLLNILNQFEATTEEVVNVKTYFKDKTVSYSSVSSYLNHIRSLQ